MTAHHLHPTRRRLLVGAASATLGTLGMPALASSRRPLASMTEGPFYPPRSWRERQHADWDADLAQVRRGSRVSNAQGELLGLEGQVMDSAGRAIDGVEIEIWQCDALGRYTHPLPSAGDGFDEGFQGYGAARSDAEGRVRFRTIRPMPYPGRTPHIHITVRHASFGERTSQLFVADDPGNARDWLWRRLSAEDREALAMRLQPAPAGSGLRWLVRQPWVVPA